MKILIVGASGGIGQFLTQKFDIDTNELYLTYNTSKDKIYKTRFAKTHISQCNFMRKNDVEEVFSKIESLDVIINVMGTVENNLIARMSEEEWDQVISSNLKTVFLSCRYGISKIVENGHIINFSSVLGSTGMIGASNYVASKGAVEAFTKSFALECLHRNRVFVNTIALGYFKIGMGLNLTDKISNMIKDKIPLKEFGEPDEIFKLVEYILSSKYLIGQIIHLNGGLYI